MSNCVRIKDIINLLSLIDNEIERGNLSNEGIEKFNEIKEIINKDIEQIRYKKRIERRRNYKKHKEELKRNFI
ncbi:MAG: hypothetical protein WC877_01910 [Dehalococcoidales bacterium]|jgi:hypothetical protein